LAASGLLAQLLVGKYCDHLPFYRQEQMFWQRHGVFIARQQMVQWTAQSVRLLSGITDCRKGELQQSGYVQVDETGAVSRPTAGGPLRSRLPVDGAHARPRGGV